jgi:hypothetical protein
MAWIVQFHDDFADEFRSWRHDVQRAAATSIATLQLLGPTLARPHADTLKASRHGNMKELRFSVGDGEWRMPLRSTPADRPSCWQVPASRVSRRIGSIVD